jgi:hypothetical protein
MDNAQSSASMAQAAASAALANVHKVNIFTACMLQVVIGSFS